MSLKTPKLIRNFQRKLYLKEKEAMWVYTLSIKNDITSVCYKVKSVGKSDALVAHVRFDERGWETELG